MGTNPFRPTFGTPPPWLAGRDELVDAFASAIDDGPGSPGRATIYTGPRGSGKTVLLNAVEDAARERGWWVISENADTGLIRRLSTDHLPAVLAEIDQQNRTTRLKGVSAPLGLGGASWETSDRHVRQPAFRSQLAAAADLMGDRGSGVVITVDEIHGGVPAELRELAMGVQHCFRELRQVAFVAAGLPAAVEDRLLNDKVITFLRRADRHVLGLLEPDDVAQAIRRPVDTAGRSIDGDALDAAVELVAGYPFMIQLVGYHSWRVRPDAATITLSDVDVAAPAVHRRLGTLVHEPSLADISENDRAFLSAMAVDDGPSRIADVAARLGVDGNYANQYRARLMAAELLVAPARGYVDFELPYLREFLRERRGIAHSIQPAALGSGEGPPPSQTTVPLTVVTDSDDGFDR